MDDRSRHASSNYALVGPDLASAAAPIPAAPSHPPTVSYPQQVPNAGPAVVQGAYWMPPLAPRLTAAAPRAAAWPNQDIHYGYNTAARHDPWASRYGSGPGLGGYQRPHQQQQWNDGRLPNHAFPPHAQPHQQLEHQLLLHHYLSKLQTEHDSSSNRHQTQAYQRSYHHSQPQEQHRQQYYSGSAAGPQNEFGAYHPAQPPVVPSSRQWSSFGHAPASRQTSVGPGDHIGHDWNSHARQQQQQQANAAAHDHQARASYVSNWQGSEWAQGDEWAESRGQAYRDQQQQRHGYASNTWSHSNGGGPGTTASVGQYEARAGSNASWDHFRASDFGNGFGPGGRQLPAPTMSRHHQPQPQQHYQHQQQQQAQPHVHDSGADGTWYHATSHGGPRKESVVPNLALVSPAPPPSPTGVPLGNGQGQGAGANPGAANGTQNAGPAPPSPATIDKSSVPIYEIGVELVNAVCKSVLGCVTNDSSRTGSAATETPMVMSPPSSGMMSPLSRADVYEDDEAGWNSGRGDRGSSQNRARQGSQQSRTSSTSRHRHGSQTQSFGGLGMYHARSGNAQTASGAYSSNASLSASQLASLMPSSSQLSAADRANSSEDSSGEDSSEPGTPASSISGDEHDEFYPKPLPPSSNMMMLPLSPPNGTSGLTVPDSAPPQLRTAINFSLDQSGIWGQPGKTGSFDADASAIAQGWATASPAMARPIKAARKSDSHSQRPSMIGTFKQSCSYSSSKTATQDMAFEDESNSGTAVGGSSGDTSSASTLMADGPLSLLSPSWPWTTVADDFFSMPMCHGRSYPFETFTMMEDAFVFRSHLEASGAASPTLHTDIKTAFARFAHQVLSQTLLSPTAFMLGLLYILRVPSLVLASDGNVKDEARALFAEPPSAAPFKLFTLGMMIANKQLDDNTFTNRTWQEVTGIPLLDLNKLERFYLERCHFEINVPPEVWYAFLGRLRDRENERRLQVDREAMQSPRSMLAQGSGSSTLSGFDPIVSSSTSRRVSTILKTLLNGEESISPILGSVGEPALALAADLLSSSPAAVDVGYRRDSDEYSGSARLADDPRYSAPAYHPDADVFDDDSGPCRQRAYRPHSAAAHINGLGNYGSPFELSRSQSDPAAICA
ncbi:hypothetical protein OC861_004959 [Tilletia horrida]|nr:hypothetical protein OC861_004959 [Tilletia horrida]